MKLIHFDLFTTDGCFFLCNVTCASLPDVIHLVIEICTYKNTACGMPTGGACVIKMHTQAAILQSLK
jgi:hypothetical protein